jgi:hypothetical protein
MNRSQIFLGIIFLINLSITMYIMIFRVFRDPQLYFVELIQTVIISFLLLYLIIVEQQK